jgi:hypothetical protein
MLCACACIMKKREREGQVISCFRVNQICKGKKEKEDGKEKSISATVSCLCMKDNDFSSYMLVPLIFFCIHLDWHRVYMCVLATMRYRTRSTNERHAYGERENDGAVRCSSCGTNLIPLSFFSRFLFSLLMLMRFLSLSLSDISSSSRARPTLTYREKSAYAHTHILTQTLGHASIHIYTKKMT